MHSCVFVVPFAMPDSLRYLRAVLDAGVPGLRLGVVSQEPRERLGSDLGGRIAGFVRVSDALHADPLTQGIRELAPALGNRVDSILGILEQLQVPLAEARKRLGVPGTDPAAAHNMRDKARMKTVLAAHGLPCARHALVEEAAHALRAAEDIGFPMVVKPPDGAGSAGTARLEDLAQLRGWLDRHPPQPGRPLLMEEFVLGREFSFDTASLNGRHLFHSVSSYEPGPLEVLENPWIQWTVLLPRDVSGPEFAPIHRAGPAALDALGMRTGMTHMEWFRRPDGSIAISEVAARPPGAQFTSLIGYAHDIDFYRVWARLVTMGDFTPPARRYAAGAAYLRAQGPGQRIAGVRGLRQIRDQLGGLVVEAKLPTEGQPPSGAYTGEGHILVRDPDTEVVRDALRRIVSSVRVDLA